MFFLLRENSPDESTIHPKSREMLISPLDVPADLNAVLAQVTADGVLVVEWSTGDSSQYHPGWLRQYAWFEGDDAQYRLSAVTNKIRWDAETLTKPPSFDGSRVLNNKSECLKWLEALSIYGVARLTGLPDEDGLLEKTVRSIGPPRESNFGPQYVLEIKDDPDSNAFTSGALLQHIDMPTRECPHGLQFFVLSC